MTEINIGRKHMITPLPGIRERTNHASTKKKTQQESYDPEDILSGAQSNGHQRFSFGVDPKLNPDVDSSTFSPNIHPS